MENNIKVRKIIWCIVLLITFSGIYALNYYFPLFTDDWSYSFVYGRDTDRVTGFLDVFESQYVHYFTWGGRCVVHTIAQSLLYMGEFWSDLLNSIAYVVLITVIYFIADYRRRIDPLLFIGLSALIWFLIPEVMFSIVWLTGSANYLWGCLLIILFMYPYCMYYLKDKQQKRSTIRCILFFFFGIIAGWTNENMVAALIAFLLVYMMLLRYEKRKIPLWVITGFIGIAIGAFMMLAAPGNFIRNKIELSVIHGINKDNFDYTYYFYRFVSVVKTYFIYGLVPTLIYLTMVALYWWKGIKENKTRIFRLSFLIFTMAAIATLVMTAAPIFPERVWFGIIILMLVATSLLYMNLDFSYRPFCIGRYIIWIPLIILCGYSYTFTLNDTIRLWKTFDERESYIKEEKKKGVEEFVLYDKFIPNDSPLYIQKVYDIPHLENDLWEIAYAKYYGIKSIEIKEASGK